MQLFKTNPLALAELKFNQEAGTFKGYASVFGGVDSYQDTILKGAYLDTLKADGMPKMFFNHQHGMPVGKYTLADEDSKGLWVEGELTPGHSLASDVRAAMRHETLDGLSIGGVLRKGDFNVSDQGGRIIHKWSKLLEVSPVVFPADGAARIDPLSVKSMDFEALLPECKTERDIEQLLRDSGLGKWEAMAIVSRVKAIATGRDSQSDDQTKADALILQRLQKLAA
jgi:HK97 family phage prohead protease